MNLLGLEMPNFCNLMGACTSTPCNWQSPDTAYSISLYLVTLLQYTASDFHRDEAQTESFSWVGRCTYLIWGEVVEERGEKVVEENWEVVETMVVEKE